MIQNISPDTLQSMIDADPSLFLLDVREQKELAMIGYIPNIVNIPSWMIPKQLDKLPRNLSKQVVVICQTGARSYSAAQFLESKGYENVYNLQSGTMGWILSGKKVKRETFRT